MKYNIPAEFDEHQSTWIAWPHNKQDWPGKFTPINWVYTEITKNLALSEKVNIIAKNKDQKLSIINSLNKCKVDLTNINIHIFNTDRSWLRDTFPQFVVNKESKELNLVRFKFNGWAKYSNYFNDIKLPDFIKSKLKLNLVNTKFKNKQVILEGGSIDYNGKGTLISTEECLLDKKIQVRNPDFSKKDYEDIFKEYLGCNKVIWLGKGIAGDDTHGHIDDICRFVKRDTVLLVQESNSRDENYKSLNENREKLQNIYLTKNTKLIVDFLPMPKPIVFQNQRVPASYANFYIGNNTILVPTFNDEQDYYALGKIKEHFPDRKVIGINSVDLVWGLGTLHCLTHEQPKI